MSTELTSQRFPSAPTEVDALLAAMHRNRRTFAWKCFGLTQEQMSQRLEPSALTLGGLVKHLALVEDHYFTHQLHGHDNPQVWSPLEHNDNWDFESAVDDTPDELRALWLEAVARSDAAIDEALADGGLDRLVERPGDHAPYNTRRLLVDMVEEYARHTGHADLIRESIDGLVGEDAPAE